MHYKNGRAANVGDLVRGKGYTIKHEIVGLLLSANAAATTCNCSVATVSVGSQVKAVGWLNKDKGFVFPKNAAGETVPGEVVATIEYGQLDAFEAINPSTGEVLPPEPVGEEAAAVEEPVAHANPADPDAAVAQADGA